MDKSQKRQNRRSQPNLQLFTIKPLTSTIDQDPSGDTDSQLQTPSYLAATRSLPQTPSILSRSSSRTRVGNRSSHALADLDGPGAQGDVSQAKNHSRTKSGRIKFSDSGDWLLQTASTLATSTAESKGQAWLATRSSSTSLVHAQHELPESAYRADDEFSPFSTRHGSRPQSRGGSRVGSRFTSRRGSRVGVMTPLGMKTPGDGSERGDYFDNMSVDFVDSEMGDEYSDGEENEVKNLVMGRAKGWVDWAVGWLDFRGDEDSFLAFSEEEEKKNEGADIETEEAKRERRRRIARRRAEREAGNEAIDVPPAPKEGAGVLTDAAWLLGVAKSAV